MNLPDFHKDKRLNDVKARMAIPEDKYGSVEAVGESLTPDQDAQIKKGGIPLDSWVELQVLPDCTLAFKNSRVLLYIFCPGTGLDPRFHVANCDTLENMRRAHRSDRYVVSTNTSGEFDVHRLVTGRTQPEKLSVCQHCLALLSFNGFHKDMTKRLKKEMVDDFVLDDFFAQYPVSLHGRKPRHSSATAPVNDYSMDFKEISRNQRKAAGWRCQQCALDLSAEHLQEFLHVHHLNGMKCDNRRENMQVVCLECHSDKPNHGHMKNSPQYRRFHRLTNALPLEAAQRKSRAR